MADPIAIDPVDDPTTFIQTEAQANPAMELEQAVRVADAFRRVKIVADRKERTIRLIAGLGMEEPTSAPAELPEHLYQPRAVGKR